MVQYDDFYEILGVPRNADDAQIKKAFRKLARQWHPDSNPNNKVEAENKFKKINQAHSILSDPEKRAQYDRLGHMPHGSEFKPPPGFDPNFSGTNAGNFADLFEMLFSSGSMGGGNFGGSSRGANPFGNQGFGNAFGGAQIKGDDVSSNLVLTLEESFHGVSKRLNFGKLGTVEVKIPAGVVDGNKIRLSGKGNPSPYGGPSGDLFLIIHLAKHAHFVLNGENIESSLSISITDAVFGCQKSVQTLSGQIDLTIPSGIQSGQKLRLTGQGRTKKGGGKGDHLLQILIKVPKTLSDQQRKLFEELKELEANEQTA